jgi:N6-adenosine-specific RNA methylase IME4
VRVVDEDGWLVFVRPDGRRLMVAPGTAEQLRDAGLLPPLPDAVVDPDVSAADPGVAFAAARLAPGACRMCAGRDWWRPVAEPDALPRCRTCHPPAIPTPTLAIPTPIPAAPTLAAPTPAVTTPADWPFAGQTPRSFKAIIADPPWAFRAYSDKGLKKSPQQHYACMDLAAIKALPVAGLAHPDGAALALWATAPMLPQAIEVMEAWGFTYKTAGAWAKQSRTGEAWGFGTGHILRSAAEFFLIGTIGSPPVLAHDVRNLIVAPIREHSRKPDALHAAMVRLYGGPGCELFARESRTGWSAWGDESDRFDAPDAESGESTA